MSIDLERTPQQKVIAQTYEQLQSLSYIDAHYQQIAHVKDTSQKMLFCLVSAAELIFLNCGDLINRKLKEIQDPEVPNSVELLYSISGSFQWHGHAFWLLNSIVSKGIDLSLSMHESNNKYEDVVFRRKLHSYNYYISQRVDLDKQLRLFFSDYRLDRALRALRTNADYSIITHKLKNINNILFRVTSPYLSMRSELIESYDDSNLANAVIDPEINSHGDYLSQFRLYHQIPEMIARCLNDIILLHFNENCTNSDVSQVLWHISIGLEIILESLRPLVDLMIPGQYHRIREQLGRTSGSHSKSLAKGSGLFRKNFLMIRRYADQHPEMFPDGSLAKKLLNAITRQISEWKYLHMSFPRNVLGGSHTASLAGAPDAIASAAGMFGSVHGSGRGRVPLETHGGTSISSEQGLASINFEFFPSLERIAEFDTRLLDATARITKDTFWYVQERAKGEEG